MASSARILPMMQIDRLIVVLKMSGFGSRCAGKVRDLGGGNHTTADFWFDQFVTKTSTTCEGEQNRSVASSFAREEGETRKITPIAQLTQSICFL